MRNQIVLLSALAVLILPSCDTLQQMSNQVLSSEEIARGLKQALEFGISEGTAALSQKDGYFKSQYKILLPEEARQVTDKLHVIPGFAQVEDIILERINRAAEDAAGKARPIFSSALQQMTFQDATSILMGQQDAATTYLYAKTHDALYAEFHPVIISSLEKFNAIEYWSDAVEAYNKIPFVEKVNPELDVYVTEKALDGLFGMVRAKELRIREDVSERTTDLLKRVFAKQD